LQRGGIVRSAPGTAIIQKHRRHPERERPLRIRAPPDKRPAIYVRDVDLANDLIGKVSFTEMMFFKKPEWRATMLVREQLNQEIGRKRTPPRPAGVAGAPPREKGGE
jgi:hypothetical protein